MIEPEQQSGEDQEANRVLGDLQKGSMDIRGCFVGKVLCINQDGRAVRVEF